MTKRTRSLGLIIVLATCITLMVTGSAAALPAGTPKVGMVCTPGSVSGSTHTFYLRTSTGYIQTPDGNTVFMWSYAVAPPDDLLGAGGVWPDFQSPGPVLCVTQGETVVINLTNTLPEPSSIMFPGQDAQVAATGGVAGLLTTEATPSGGIVSYSFVANNPGTYIYESGSNVSKQVEMGLYGAIIVRPNAVPAGGADPDPSHYAYGLATTRFDPSREYMLLIAEMDPALHHAVEIGGTYDFSALHNRYFTVNGRSFPDTIQNNGSALLPSQPYGALVRLQPTTPTTQPALVRMLNVGVDNHPYHPHGNHLREIAQDGRLFLSPTGADASTEHFGETIGSGATEDYLIRWDNQTTDTAGIPFNDDWNPTTNPLPVAQPNYLNLTFKDGNTWYSGNPYLGYKGTLPTGTTSQNICGEWYFPWHSHALNEFSNFDEGFGGLATLLRVDPFGGCFSAPTSTRILAGTLNSGSVTNLGVVDTSYYKINSTTSGTRTSDWYAQFSGILAGSTNLVVTYQGRNCATTGSPADCPTIGGIPTTLSVWNWTTSTWVQLGASTSIPSGLDTTVTRAITNPATNYIGTGSNKGLVRIRVLSTGSATNFVTNGNFMKLVYDAP